MLLRKIFISPRSFAILVFWMWENNLMLNTCLMRIQLQAVFFMAGEMVLVHVSVTCMQAKQHALIGSI